MSFDGAKRIWMNGRLIPWEKATVHVMAHALHYGSSIFEGIRSYKTPDGSRVFRLTDHMRRFVNSAKIYRMPLGYELDAEGEPREGAAVAASGIGLGLGSLKRSAP